MSDQHQNQHTLRESERAQDLRIQLLGGFRVTVGGRIVDESAWHLSKAKRLFQLLALAPRHRLYREEVMNLLWPDSNPVAAANSLHQAIRWVRRALEPATNAGSSYVHVRDEHIVLCPFGSLWTDVEAFESAAVTARRTRNPAHYNAAVALYTGDLLPGHRYDDLVQSRNDQLRQSYLALLLELAQLHEERRAYRPAIEVLQRAIGSDPLLEEAHAGLMRLYASSGQQQKAIRQYKVLREALRELATEPDSGTERLYEDIRTGRVSFGEAQQQVPVADSCREASCPRRHNLPVELTSFVGRKTEISEAKHVLAENRLLTLVGGGGAGKTRLGLAVARQLVANFVDGVWIVELASLREPALVPDAVALALGIQEEPGRSATETLVQALRARELLLFLDNCEHLLDACSEIVVALLRACPSVKVLATSREQLRVPGEVSWIVPSLSIPDSAETRVEALEEYEAVRLFVERACARHATFVLDSENARAVAGVCRRLGGVPLAIELAAGRMHLMTVQQIAERLDSSLRLLGQDIPSATRHRSIRMALDWSYDLLDSAEQTLLARLSVFSGGWTLEAAETVCGGDQLPVEDTLDVLSRLVDKSLVEVEAASANDRRCAFLEPVRQYARERLEQTGQSQQRLRQHASFYLSLAEQADPQLSARNQVMWLERLEREHDNLRSALTWLFEQGEYEMALRLTGGLWRFWHYRGHISEGRRWVSRALEKCDKASTRVRAKVLRGAGAFAWDQSEFELARRFNEEALVLQRQVGDSRDIADTLTNLGQIAIDQRLFDRARELLEESLALRTQLGDENGLAHSLQNLAVAAMDQGNYEDAEDLLRQALTLQRKLGNTLLAGVSLCNLGLLALFSDQPEQAMTLLEESLALRKEVGDRPGLGTVSTFLGYAALQLDDHRRALELLEEGMMYHAEVGNSQGKIHCLSGLAELAAVLGHVELAARLWGAAESAREVLGTPIESTERALFRHCLTATESPQGRTHRAVGRMMTLDQALEFALAAVKPALKAHPIPHRSGVTRALSNREREVSIHVARGLTNRAIAVELGLAERTVETHVHNILQKLELQSRAQIAAWVVEARLLTIDLT